LADIYFGWPVNKYGYRPFCVGAQLAIAVGLVLFACAPWILPGHPFVVFALATVIFSVAAGLLEVLLSPIAKTIPAENSEANFMIMHSAFAGGIFAAALVTTLLLRLLGNDLWQVVVVLWALIPLLNAFQFIRAPLPAITPVAQRMKARRMLRSPVFIVAFFAIFFGAATELLIVQWGSSYLERGMGFPRPSVTWWGSASSPPCWLWPGCCTPRKGRTEHEHVDDLGLRRLRVLYAVVALAPSAWLVLLAFGLIGFCASMFWTGTLIVAPTACPTRARSSSHCWPAEGTWSSVRWDRCSGGCQTSSALTHPVRSTPSSSASKPPWESRWPCLSSPWSASWCSVSWPLIAPLV
jgi:MFS family permease